MDVIEEPCWKDLVQDKINFFTVMQNSYKAHNEGELIPKGSELMDIGHVVLRHACHHASKKSSLPWLDLKVFYVRVSKCEINELTLDYLTVNHTPLHPDALLEVNGVRTSINSDGALTFLRRDRLDKISEEATFVSTDSIRMTGSVKFEVFNKDVLVLSGVLESLNNNGSFGESRTNSQGWSMHCESDITFGSGLLTAKQFMVPHLASPMIEVYVAGSFSGTPIILSKTLQLCSHKKQIRKGMLDSIPEHETSESRENVPCSPPLQLLEYPIHRPENGEYDDLFAGTECLVHEDGELSWFKAGVRVGVGIGLSICLGIGIGVGLLVKTYQGTTSNLRRRLP
uniref:Uncharacterized protein MANES_17G100900 n=1 Tax=Rhizophora mucronata TaxID=61149 RepID=A0A2P2K150_RHIMU